jgi:phosphomevalonate kinase
VTRLVAASAPGKMMVSGEYAVLEGAVAVVASVNVRAYARWSMGAPSGSPAQIGGSQESPRTPPEAVLTRKLAEEAVGVVQAELAIDASELRRSGRKLGLGSSAAAAAAAAGAVLASAGEDLTASSVQRRVLELALRGHKAIAPEGSGADVAASSLGGFVRFRLEAGQLAEAERMAWPAQVATRVVWTGKEARTSEFVRAVRAFEGRDASGYGAIRDTLHAEAAHFAEAIVRADAAEIVAAAGAYGSAMGDLGRAAGVSIMTSELQQIADLARRHGGAAKPSGAGGGDVAIAFFARESDALSFDAACRAEALDLLDLGLGAPGVRPETA